MNLQWGLIGSVVEANAAGGRVRSLFPETNQFIASDHILRQTRSGRPIYLSGAWRSIEKTVFHLSKFSVGLSKSGDANDGSLSKIRVCAFRQSICLNSASIKPRQTKRRS
jgi:hypothetical protein